MQQAVPKNVVTYVTRDGKDVFQGWLDGLADRQARVLVDKTIAKVRLGNLGRHKSVGQGVQEIVLNYGPGYRNQSKIANGVWTPLATKGDACPLWKPHLIVPASRGGVNW